MQARVDHAQRSLRRHAADILRGPDAPAERHTAHGR